MSLPPDPIRIGLVDDSPTDRADLETLVRANAPRSQLIFSVASLAALQTYAAPFWPDVVLVDLNLGLGQPDGFAVLNHYRQAATWQALRMPKLVVVSSNVSAFMVAVARHEGATGMIRKSILTQNPALFAKLMQRAAGSSAGSFWLEA
jgi:CheY-like chemotaxis protein